MVPPPAGDEANRVPGRQASAVQGTVRGAECVADGRLSDRGSEPYVQRYSLSVTESVLSSDTSHGGGAACRWRRPCGEMVARPGPQSAERFHSPGQKVL